MLSTLRNILQFLLIGLCFLIPIAWWTRLNANYHSTKMFLFYFVAGLAIILLPSKVNLPKFKPVMLTSLLLIFLFQIGLHFHNFLYDEILYFFKFFSFLLLVVYFYASEVTLKKIFNKTSYFIFITIVTILSFALYEFYDQRIVNMSLFAGRYLTTFGNVNMFSEFLVLTLPFLFHWTRYKDKIPNWLKLLLFSIWLFFIMFCRSRSAWMGLGLWYMLQFKYKVNKRELLFLLIPFVFYFTTKYAPSKVDNTPEVKESSANERMGLYEATLRLIKENPWGLDAGRFMGEIQPYQMESSVKPSESTYFDQPHSEFLKWAAQFGWIFAGLAGVFISISCIYLIRWWWRAEDTFLLETFAVLLPQMIFQFPFENPASLLFLSLAFAIFFGKFRSEKVLKILLPVRVILVVIGFLCIANSVAFLNSIYQESTFTRSEKIISACEYYPISLKTCHAKLIYLIDNKRHAEFIKEFPTYLSKQTFFVDYLKLLPTYYSLKGNNKRTCQSLFLYKVMFPETETFEKKYFESCKGFPDIFYFQNPKQFREQYLNWLSQDI